MISRNIDLTEHRDFSGGDAFIIPFDIELIDRAYEDGYMSIDQYEQVVKWEGIFGRKRHTSEARKIFDMPVPKDWQHKCARCGKVIKAPWDNIYGLCLRCNESLEMDSYSRIPWSPFKIVYNRIPRDLFDLR